VDIQPVDLTALISAILGISIVLIPVAGFTLRFALKPFVEVLAVARRGKNSDAELSLLEQRVALLERQMEAARSLLPPPVANVGEPLPNSTISAVRER
jgi:hypothetical protein